MRRLFVRGLFVTLLAGAASTTAVAGDREEHGGDRDHRRCQAIDGPFTSTLIPPPQCASPVGLCTHGILHGDLEATYDFTAATLMPVDDPEHPGRLVYTGTSVITPAKGSKPHGQLFSDDTGYLDPDPASPMAYFATTVHVVRGTKDAKHTTGSLIAEGALNFITGAAVGSYSGELCGHDD